MLGSLASNLMVGAAALLGMSLPGRKPVRPARRPNETRKRRKPPKNRTPQVHGYGNGIDAAKSYLGKREMHAANASTIRKLQRAFRIAGSHFELTNPKSGRARP